MGGRASRQKGSRAELEVAELIKLWLRDEHPAAEVIRTPASGGHWARDALTSRGDLIIKQAPFPWCVEVKRREDWTLERFTNGRPSPALEWWGQACRDAAAAKLAPMLWARRSNADWLVLLPRKALALACPRAPMPDVVFGPRLWHPGAPEPVGYWAPGWLDHPPRTWFGRVAAWGEWRRGTSLADLG